MVFALVTGACGRPWVRATARAAARSTAADDDEPVVAAATSAALSAFALRGTLEQAAAGRRTIGAPHDAFRSAFARAAAARARAPAIASGWSPARSAGDMKTGGSPCESDETASTTGCVESAAVASVLGTEMVTTFSVAGAVSTTAAVAMLTTPEVALGVALGVGGACAAAVACTAPAGGVAAVSPLFDGRGQLAAAPAAAVAGRQLPAAEPVLVLEVAQLAWQVPLSAGAVLSPVAGFGVSAG